MKEKMKKLKNGFLRMPKKRKVELVAAVIISVSLIVSIPITAWFGYQRKIIKLQKINSPNTLILSAAHGEDTICFNIDGIDADEKIKNGNSSEISDQRITHKDYVFCVAGEAVSEFTMQLAYTTNNPFTYQIFASDEHTEKPAFDTNAEAPFVEYTYTGDTISGMPDTVSFNDVNTSSTLYYTYGANISGTYLNLDTSNNDATNSYHNETYSGYNTVHKDAEPVYWQATGVKTLPGGNFTKAPFYRHFILRVSWPDGALNNTTKETDIIYLTVKATK